MEWTKFKPKHFLYTDYTMGNIGCLTVLICLTAQLERLPTERERVQHTHIRALESLHKAMISKGYTLDEVLLKVLEDSDNIEHQRKLNAKHQKTYREKHKPTKRGSKPLHKPLEEIRGDKRREDIYKEQITEIVEDLNLVLHSHYKPSNKKTKELIVARLKEGHTVEEFKKVHRVKSVEWQNDERMRTYLRPQTLYSGNFESYVNQKPKVRVFK